MTIISSSSSSPLVPVWVVCLPFLSLEYLALNKDDQDEAIAASQSKSGDQSAGFALRGDEEGRQEITHMYNHIYGLSVTWGRPDMAYFSFTQNILQGKPKTVYRGKNKVDLARDFTYIDDIVMGCVGSLDTAGRSTGSDGKKKGPTPYGIYNLGNTSPVQARGYSGKQQCSVHARKYKLGPKGLSRRHRDSRRIEFNSGSILGFGGWGRP